MDRSIATRFPRGGSALWSDGAAASLLRAEFFGAAVGDGAGGGLFFWSGSAWLPATVKRWNGTEWQTVNMRYWDGAVWQLTRDTPPIPVVVDVAFPTGTSEPAGLIASTAGASGSVSIGAGYVYAVIEVEFYATGEIYVRAEVDEGSGPEFLLATNGAWVTGPFVAADYEIQFAVLTSSGYAPTGDFDVWSALTSTREFSISSFDLDTQASIRVRIRRASDAALLETYVVNLSITAI